MFNSWFDTWPRISLSLLDDLSLPKLPGLIALRGSNDKIYFVAYLTVLADFREKLSCQFGNPIDVAQVFDPDASIIFWCFPQEFSVILGSQLIEFVNQIAEDLPLKRKLVSSKLLTASAGVETGYANSQSELIYQ